MFKFINKIFGKQSQTKKIKEKPLEIVKGERLDDLFLKHFNESFYFKESSFETVIKHLKHDIDLNKSGEKLTTSKKKELGINTRLSITSDLVAVLSKKGIELSNPKYALKQVYYRATFEENRLENFQKMISVGVSEATYKSCSDERDCSWCKANNGVVFSVSKDLNNEINKNCKCDWNRGIFTGNVNF